MTKQAFRIRAQALILAAPVLFAAAPAWAQTGDVGSRMQALEARLEMLEKQNSQLIDALKGSQAEAENRAAARAADEAAASAAADAAAAAVNALPYGASDGSGPVGTSAAYSFKILDVAENVTTKPLVQLQALQVGEIDDAVTISGGVAAIVDYQLSNTAGKFGYLTRHPSVANQVGKDVSEAVLHSAALAMTARLPGDLTAYFELLYDPQTSFGSGTITDLNRNQIQLRRGWLMWGNLDKRPVYALVGKMDVPFGLNDTVSPFTPSTNYHAFAALAYGAQLGYYANGLHLRAMAIQGGAQFRSANTPVGGSAVPSRLNNFAVDANYTLGLGETGSVMVGGSYQHGTAYCQDYPVFHFNPCSDNVPGVAAYARAQVGDLTLLGEYAQTTKVWNGTAVPARDPRVGVPGITPPQKVWTLVNNPLSVYEAVKPKSFTLGGRFAFGEEVNSTQGKRTAVSLEFSRFISGANGSPWEGQSQTVLGLSQFISPSVNLFSELTYVDGFVPLNFLSGGNNADGTSWSDQGVDTGVALVGIQAAF